MAKLPMRRFLKHKYHAKPTNIDGVRYDSKKEACYAGQLKILQQTGKILFFLRQVPFDLPGKTKYRCDFMEFWADGTIKFVEIKGFENQTWKLKKKLVESLYPIKIEVK